MKRIFGVISSAVVGALVLASTALAQATQQGGYPGGGVAGDVTGQLGGVGGQAGGTLPFTGLNLVLLVVGGVVLIGLGVLLVVRGRSSAAAG